MKRLLLQRNGMALTATRFSLQFQLQPRRGLAWNPFSRLTLEEADEEQVDDIVINAAQELRRDVSSRRLKEILHELVDATADTKSFSLMNEVIKKIEQTPQNSVTDGIIAAKSNELLSLEEKFFIFTQVISRINRENFQAARFIPRLYMQLTTTLYDTKPKNLLLETFKEFNRYLAILCHGEQLFKVIVSFVNDNNALKSKAARQTLSVLSSLEPMAPSVYINAFEAYNFLGLNSQELSEFQELVISNTISYIKGYNDLMALEANEVEKIRSFIKISLKSPSSPALLLRLLKLTSLNNALSNDQVDILIRFTSLLLNDTDLSGIDTHSLRQILEALIDSREISRNEVLVVGSKIIDEVHARKLSILECAEVELPWTIYSSGELTRPIKSLLLENKQLGTTEVYNTLLSALARSDTKDFESKHEELNTFFKQNFPHVDKNLHTYEVLMNKGICHSDVTLLKKIFDDSIEDGINWEAKPDVLYKFVKVLADDPNADVKDVFGWYKRVKFFAPYLDGDSYSSLMRLYLNSDYIGDAIESLKRELPELAEGSKYEAESYPALFQTIYNWLINDSNEIQEAWEVYGALQKYFEIPYEKYFPIMKKFVFLGRPDASMKIFEQMKKIHRTTGKIPPPTADIYVYLFKNFGEYLYEDGVELLHMILKTDLHINADIEIMNSVLEAYSNLEDFKKVSDTFDQIIALPKKNGLNHRTISIMIKAYTFLSLEHVKNFWNNLDELNLLPNSDNFNQYIIAHCYHEQYDQALQIAETMEDFDVEVTPQIIETLYKWTAEGDRRLLVESWAAENYNDIWKNIDKNSLALVENEVDEFVASNALSLIRNN